MMFDTDKDDDEENCVTIRVQKRNGKKCITIITGFAKDLDLDKILKHLKKTFSCNGSISNDEKFGEVLKLTGDKKENVYKFLISEQIYKKECIIIKGV